MTPDELRALRGAKNITKRTARKARKKRKQELREAAQLHLSRDPKARASVRAACAAIPHVALALAEITQYAADAGVQVASFDTTNHIHLRLRGATATIDYWPATGLGRVINESAPAPHGANKGFPMTPSEAVYFANEPKQSV